jgi:hypothetical protein
MFLRITAPMLRSTINFDTVRKIGLALPGVEESAAYGLSALKVHGKLLACVPSHRSAEPGSLWFALTSTTAPNCSPQTRMFTT